MLALEIPSVSCQLEKFDSLEGLLNTCSGIARVSSGTRSPGHRCMGLWFNRNRGASLLKAHWLTIVKFSVKNLVDIWFIMKQTLACSISMLWKSCISLYFQLSAISLSNVVTVCISSFCEDQQVTFKLANKHGFFRL